MQVLFWIILTHLKDFMLFSQVKSHHYQELVIIFVFFCPFFFPIWSPATLGYWILVIVAGHLQREPSARTRFSFDLCRMLKTAALISLFCGHRIYLAKM